MRICVTGAAGFVGHHLCRFLKGRGHFVTAVDWKRLEWGQLSADEFLQLDLRDRDSCLRAFRDADWAFALAANMGGMGFIGRYHAEIIRDNTMINVNSIEAARLCGVRRYLFTSSACVYPEYLQGDDGHRPLAEPDVYPAQPQEAYGWEKLHAEHLCRYYHEQGWLDTRVVRFHNVYGPEGAWNDGREKAPAAICRKVAVAKLAGKPAVEIWGDGQQVRSYMYIGDCLEGLWRLMCSDHGAPLNLGSEEAVTVDGLVDLVADLAGVSVEKVHVPGPEGVRWRNSDNRQCRAVLGWEPRTPLAWGLAPTYEWIEAQVREAA